MHNPASWRNGLSLLFAIFLFIHCSTPATEKITPKSYIVEIKQMKFVPDLVNAQKGDTITWINKDIVNHDVTEVATGAWTSGILPFGKSWSLVVANSSDYYCSIHVVMIGRIKVD
jgi:plastocyanin